MSLRVIGINHKTAPVAIREKVAFSPDGLIETLSQIKNDIENNHKDNEVIILSTCNRTEIYTYSNYTEEQILDWLSKEHGMDSHNLKEYIYNHANGEAIKHVMRVASGLDSMVLGEPQIFGQLKGALKTASEKKTAGTTLKRLMQHAFSTAKKVRTQTGIGTNPVSVAFAAVNLAKQIFSNLDNKTALLIGAGETIELVGKHLNNANIGKVIIANRSVEKATQLANEFNGLGITLQDIGDYLPDADIVISSTAAPMPIIGKGTVEAALKKRKHKPIFMVDIAVPRDIEEEVGELDDIYLYTVDDLQSVIEDNMKSRQEAALQGEEMIAEEVESFMGWMRAQDQMSLIKSYRDKISTIQDETLDKALKLLKNGSTADEALSFLAHTLTNKLAHDATVAMNKAAHSGDHKLLEASDKLLNLSTVETQTESTDKENNKQ
ncbi:glutamyl-tRNA reductase [uncultured Cocleimonas sp.]|uniref:glutamyl-tRNA reductase n=1 Tax=uncultured Cocleimonas sp. TaxID=1051587 RepID=UPI002638E054|nr:glutamyl-tRNA reductase [uncultured Cocleimonas sp.]